MKKTVVVSGGFDPLHVGHLRMFKEAKQLGDELIVIINNDNWIHSKKGFAFMPEDERAELIAELPFVNRVVLTRHVENDTDRSVCKLLEEIKPDIFVNGGDQFADTIPEVEVCKRLGIHMVFSVGGEKVRSSSELVQQAHDKMITTHRPWGSFKKLGEFEEAYLKTLHVHEGATLSLQRHQQRAETWLLLSGDVQAVRGKDITALEIYELEPGVPFHVPLGHLHRLSSRKGGVVAEISIGKFDENDIERIEDVYGRTTPTTD